jgi:electron transport complex protein RnfC
MLKGSFFGLAKPKLNFPVVADPRTNVQDIALPSRLSFILRDSDLRADRLTLQVGDSVKTGQRIELLEDGEHFLVSPVSGTIGAIDRRPGYFGQTCMSISIDTNEEDEWDGTYQALYEASDRLGILRFLNALPGQGSFSALLDSQPPLETIMVCGIDIDPLARTNRRILEAESELLAEGISILREITSPADIRMLATPDLASQAAKSGSPVDTVSAEYPNILPPILMKNILGKILPAGGTCEQMGVTFLSAEAVLLVAKALGRGELPLAKQITVVGKNAAAVEVRARIGTPVRDVLSAVNITTGHGDRLILNGPLTGSAVYSEDTPIMWDSTSLLVQDKDQIPPTRDAHCVNCGECIRACPADVPVNMLVRLLENGLYEEAARDYDLFSCIECGLCSYVCPAGIPVFHYVMLGKYEFTRARSSEESNA